MKKILAIILALYMIFCFVGCSGGDTTPSNTDEPSKVESTIPDNVLGDYQVEIKSCTLSKNWEDKDIAIVTFIFTNNSKDTAAFNTSFTNKAFQGDFEAETCYVFESEYSENNSKEIRSGATIQVDCAYFLNDITTDLEVEVTEWLSFSNKKITKTFSFN